MESGLSDPIIDRTAEMEIIRYCARSSMDDQTSARLREVLNRNIDWPFLLHIAAVHGVLSLLYYGLRDNARDKVPGEVFAHLQNRCVHSAAISTLLTGSLLELLQLFARHGIHAVSLKGPILAATAYEYPALRTFGDLDIMVRRKDVLRTVELLKAEGYHPFSKSGREEVLSELLESRLRKDAGFVRRDGLVFVEIHWGFLPEARSFPLRPEDAWSSCEEVSMGGVQVPSFAAEDILIFLCAHGAKHAWTRLKWICDIAEFVRFRQDTNWNRTFEEARRLRSERLLRVGLLLARDISGAPLPPPVQSYVDGDRQAESLAKEITERILSGKIEIERWEESLFWVRSREDLRDKVNGLRFYLLPHLLSPTSKDQEFVSLPRPLHFLYYLVRPLRVFTERHSTADKQDHSVAAGAPARAATESVNVG